MHSLDSRCRIAFGSRMTFNLECKILMSLSLIIAIANKTSDPTPTHAELSAITLPLMEARGLTGEWLLDVEFIDNAAMQILNLQAQGLDEPTDVLSFPVHFATNEADPTTVLPSDGPKVLGSLVIAPEVAAAQAPAHNHSTEAEIRDLIEHGIHHLLGEDHDDAGHWLPRESHTSFNPRTDVITD
jgi:probable rRNA maturation factor